MSAYDSPTQQARAASDSQAMLDMFRRIPIETLESTALDLLKATRRVRLSKDEPQGVEEPDNAVRLKVWQTIVEQRAGQAGSRKPVEPPKEDAEARQEAGTLKARRVPAAVAANQ